MGAQVIEGVVFSVIDRLVTGVLPITKQQTEDGWQWPDGTDVLWPDGTQVLTEA